MNQTNWIGETLGGRYRIEEQLGQGGMSAVYKALDPNLQRVVAIKMIHPFLSTDPKFMARFEEEARAVARLRHPNIIQVYDFNHDGDVYYMVQEYVPGETLQAVLRRLNRNGERMPLWQAVKYAMDVSSAIGYAHQMGMIHRDIKPANIMLDEHGQAILMDFGIVKILGGQSHTTTGSVVGTVIYMSPEIIRGETPDPRADIYSLGVTLFEMLSGRPPFEATSAMTLMMMHQNDPVPNMHEIRPETPESLVRIVEKCLAKKPADRFANASELAAALKTVYERLTHTQPATLIQTKSPVKPGSIPLQTLKMPPDQSVSGPLAAASVPSGTVNRSGVRVGPGQSVSNSNPGSISGSQPRPSQPIGPRRNLTPFLAGGGILLILFITGCLLFAGITVRRIMASGSTGKFLAAAEPSPSSTAPATPNKSTPTLKATPVPTSLASEATPIPSGAAMPGMGGANPMVMFPLPTVPPNEQYVRIDWITLDPQGDYVVTYETFGYTEKLPGEHIHFFFNTVTPEEAGPPGKGPWYMYGGPRPFTGYKTSDRPKGATEICALVANPDHSLHPSSGNCYPLPDVNLVMANTDSPCYAGPGEAYPLASTLKTGAVAPVDGLSPDESWWYASNPDQPGAHCWLSKQTTIFGGDVAMLQMVEPPPLPTPTPVSTAPAVEITGITINDQGLYVVNFDAHNYTPQLPGTHIHFFFNSTPADQVGLNGLGNRLMYGASSPFTGYAVSNRPDNASAMCALVANPDHSVQAGSGNCYALPGLLSGSVSAQTACLAGPLSSANPLRQIESGANLTLLGLSPDGQWLYVNDGADPSQACWIPKAAAVSSGDVSQLPVVGKPTPTPKKNKNNNKGGYNY